MSAPFEQRPTLREYLEWVRTNAGWDYRTGLLGMNTVHAITTPSGSRIPITDIQLDERLGQSMIDWLNRRTGITAPWSGIPRHS